MPLITLCGAPLAGKTTLANEIAEYAAKEYPDLDVVIINFESLKINRTTSFMNSMTEKRVNEMLRTAVERQLTLKRVVILDALNMIKGFRYELFTRAREVGTPHCVVYVETSRETALNRNNLRPESTRYPEKAFNDLFPRVEIPDPARRWDNPMFTQHENAPSIAKEIMDAMAGAKASLVSFSTTPIRLEAPTFVRDLDRLTQEVLRQIMTFQNTAPPLGSVLNIVISPKILSDTQKSLVTTNQSSEGLASVAGGENTPSHFESIPTATSAGIVKTQTQSAPAASSTSSSKIRRSGKVFGAKPSGETTTPTSALSEQTLAGAEKELASLTITNNGTTSTDVTDATSETLKESETTLPETPLLSFPFVLTRKIPLSELLSMRRNYTRVSSIMAFKNSEHMVKSFVDFLQVQIGTNMR